MYYHYWALRGKYFVKVLRKKCAEDRNGPAGLLRELLGDTPEKAISTAWAEHQHEVAQTKAAIKRAQDEVREYKRMLAQYEALAMTEAEFRKRVRYTFKEK